MYYNNKNYLILVITLIICFTFVSCGSKEVEYSNIQFKFPLQQKDVETVLKQCSLSWNVDKANIVSKYHMHYKLVDEQKALVGSINSSADNLGRYLKLSGFPKYKDIKDMKSIYKSEWKGVFKLACILYGNANKYEEIYNRFTKSHKSRNKILYWGTRIDDAHIGIYLYPNKDSKEEYVLKNITIMDNNYFESLVKSSEARWSERLSILGINQVNKLSVSEVMSMENNDGDCIKGIMVKGRIKNIKRLKLSEIDKVIPESKFVSHNEIFFTADLIDDTGTIPVILRSTTLNEEELGQIRKHYIYYYSENKTSIINFSVK